MGNLRSKRTRQRRSLSGKGHVLPRWCLTVRNAHLHICIPWCQLPGAGVCKVRKLPPAANVNQSHRRHTMRRVVSSRNHATIGCVLTALC